MAAPTWVKSSAAVTVVTTGTGTPSLAGVTVGNLIILQVFQDGGGATTNPLVDTNSTIDNLAGTGNTMTLLEDGVSDFWAVGPAVTEAQYLLLGRASATTVSADIAVGAGGDDLYAGFHEFTSVNTGTTLGDVIENSSAGVGVNGTGNTAAVSDTGVTTLGVDRLALNLIAVNDDNQASYASFTGETGGDWVLRNAIGSSTGTDGSIGLQTAAMATAGTINGGSFTMAAADNWGVVGFALIGTTSAVAAVPTRKTWPALQAVNRAGTY